MIASVFLPWRPRPQRQTVPSPPAATRTSLSGEAIKGGLGVVPVRRIDDFGREPAAPNAFSMAAASAAVPECGLRMTARREGTAEVMHVAFRTQEQQQKAGLWGQSSLQISGPGLGKPGSGRSPSRDSDTSAPASRQPASPSDPPSRAVDADPSGILRSERLRLGQIGHHAETEAEVVARPEQRQRRRQPDVWLIVISSTVFGLSSCTPS